MGSTKLGPGTLTIGAIGSEIDVSCDLDNAVITMSKTTGTEKTKLCGTVRPGSVTYAYVMNGTVAQDLDKGEDGLFALSQRAPGSEQPYTYTPNTEQGTSASGTLVLDPLDFGSTGAYGDEMTSGFGFALVGAPVYVFGGQVVATGAGAGTPGAFTPTGAAPPANLAALDSVAATPSTAWTTGQSVTLGDASSAYWNGTAWVAGIAP